MKSITSFLPWAKSKQGKSALTVEQATRQVVQNITSWISMLPDPDPVLREAKNDLETYRKMLNDGHIFGTIQQRKTGVLSLEHRIQQNKADKTVYDFVVNNIAELKNHRIKTEMLDAPPFGIQVMEKLWTQKADGKYYLNDIKAKPLDWFFFNQNNELMRKSKDAKDGASCEWYKFLYIPHLESYNNPYGTRLLSKCFWPLSFKNGGWKFAALFAEKFAIPYIVGKLPRGTNKKDQEALLSVLQNMIQDAAAVIPDDSSTEIIQANDKGGTSAWFKDMIVTANQEISKAILSQTLTTELATGGGSYAASKTHGGVLDNVIDSDAIMVEEAYNELIRDLVVINFGENVERPKFALFEEGYVNKELAERDEIILRSNPRIKFTKSHYLKNHNLKNDEFTLEEKPASEFNESNTRAIQNQDGMDAVMANLSPKKLNTFSDTITEPILEIVVSSDNLQDITDKVVARFPDMDTQELEATLHKALFASEIYGRLTKKNLN